MLFSYTEGTGHDIVFLHGWGGSTESFGGLFGALKSNFRCTNLDFYGFGKTPHPDKPLVLDDYAEGVKEVIDKLDSEDITLVGHSFGGRVAIKLSKDKRVKKLVLIDSAGIRPKRGLRYKTKVLIFKIKKKLGMDVGKYGSEDYRALPPLMQETFKNIVNEDLKPMLKEIKQPTLLIWGAEDKDTPLYMARIMEKEIGDSGLVVFEGAGHYSYVERHGEVVKILTSFEKE